VIRNVVEVILAHLLHVKFLELGRSREREKDVNGVVKFFIETSPLLPHNSDNGYI
jgi:hypothetical protein